MATAIQNKQIKGTGLDLLVFTRTGFESLWCPVHCLLHLYLTVGYYIKGGNCQNVHALLHALRFIWFPDLQSSNHLQEIHCTLFLPCPACFQSYTLFCVRPFLFNVS